MSRHILLFALLVTELWVAMISRVSLQLGVMGGVGGGRRVLSTGKVTLSRTAIRKMLLQDNDNQR